MQATHFFTSEQAVCSAGAVFAMQLTHSKLRQLINELIKEMNSRGMKVAGMLLEIDFFTCIYHVLFAVGFCSDGEFNSLWNRGYTRPLSVFTIRSDVRSKYAKMKAMLTPKGMYKYCHPFWVGRGCGVCSVVVCSCLIREA